MFYVHRNNRTYVCTCMVMGIKSKSSKCPAKRSTTEQPGQQVKVQMIKRFIRRLQHYLLTQWLLGTS